MVTRNVLYGIIFNAPINGQQRKKRDRKNTTERANWFCAVRVLAEETVLFYPFLMYGRN
jgi:hypothetical protein